jgi:hypothetical protein
LPEKAATRIAPVNSRDEDFNVRLGRIRDRGGGRSFVDQVLRAARKAGYGGSYTAGSRRFARYGHSTFGRGRAAFGRSRLSAGHRRVVVKARVVRHRGRAFRSAPLSAHIAYLERDGVTRDGEKAHMFSAAEDPADGADFARRRVRGSKSSGKAASCFVVICAETSSKWHIKRLLCSTIRLLRRNCACRRTTLALGS